MQVIYRRNPLNQISTFLLLSLGRYLYWWTIILISRCFGHIILISCRPVLAQYRSNKYQLHSLQFYQIGTRTHDLPHYSQSRCYTPDSVVNKRQRKQKGQSRLDNPETLAILCMQETGRQQTKQKTQHRNLNDNLTKYINVAHYSKYQVLVQ